MSDRDGLIRACLAEPNATTPRLALADWCDDHGDPATAHALRWMVRHGKGPSLHPMGWTWLWNTEPLKRANPARKFRRMSLLPCWIPVVVGREMCSRHPQSSRSWWVAVKRLGWALHRIRELVD